MRLSIFAYHVSLLMLEDAPTKLALHESENATPSKPVCYFCGRVCSGDSTFEVESAAVENNGDLRRRGRL